MPAEPNPATALPMMSMFEDVAVPQNKEPTMEMMLAIRNRYLTENKVRIPAHVSNGVEMVSDAGNGRGDDIHVYARENENPAHGQKDEP
ncbi:unnamed protein product [Clonostachys rhizophaga]|uniref:Uncharacterized protein n=1 Tax=Clonostachys rhizophaga TaxID=160324 RepID=A0A9N9YS83_9HYPO|nr:unnamed protein product [Clonostachys rhizophaga]